MFVHLLAHAIWGNFRGHVVTGIASDTVGRTPIAVLQPSVTGRWEGASRAAGHGPLVYIVVAENERNMRQPFIYTRSM